MSDFATNSVALASLMDFLNTWAREQDVKQVEIADPYEIMLLVDELWAKQATMIATARNHSAALVIEQCRQIAVDVSAAETPVEGDEGIMSSGFRLGWRGGLRRFLEILDTKYPSSPTKTE